MAPLLSNEQKNMSHLGFQGLWTQPCPKKPHFALTWNCPSSALCTGNMGGIHHTAGQDVTGMVPPCVPTGHSHRDWPYCSQWLCTVGWASCRDISTKVTWSHESGIFGLSQTSTMFQDPIFIPPMTSQVCWPCLARGDAAFSCTEWWRMKPEYDRPMVYSHWLLVYYTAEIGYLACLYQ